MIKKGEIKMEKKYRLTDEIRNENGNILYRIQALKDFGYVKAGNIGGWIESEDNLSHEGDCWVNDNAMVYGKSEVRGNAKVYGNSKIYDNACVCGNTYVYENSQIYGNSFVYGNAKVCGNAKVYENTEICGEVWIYDNANVCGESRVRENANICKNAEVSGNAEISGNATISKNAIIKNKKDLICISPIGKTNKPITFYRTNEGIYVDYDYFNGSIEKFEKKANEYYKDYFKKDCLEKLNLAMQLAQLSIMC